MTDRKLIGSATATAWEVLRDLRESLEMLERIGSGGEMTDDDRAALEREGGDPNSPDPAESLREALDERVLSVETRYVIVLTTGGPHVELVLDGGRVESHVYWGSEHSESSTTDDDVVDWCESIVGVDR